MAYYSRSPYITKCPSGSLLHFPLLQSRVLAIRSHRVRPELYLGFSLGTDGPALPAPEPLVCEKPDDPALPVSTLTAPHSFTASSSRARASATATSLAACATARSRSFSCSVAIPTLFASCA